MKKRYQVFVSSTYEDLKEERFEVLKALLELDCIPCGMEYFPAASDDQWSYIRELISECDYYVVIVAGRYGSTDEEGVSYTEKEFDFAVQQGIPVVGFVHPDPSSRPARFSEATDEGRQKLAAFTRKVQRKLVKYWNTPHELGAVVSRAITHVIRRTPRTGWVRADTIADGSAEEVERLRREAERLSGEVDRLRMESGAATPDGTAREARDVTPTSDSYAISAQEFVLRSFLGSGEQVQPSSTTPLTPSGLRHGEAAPSRMLLCTKCGAVNYPGTEVCDVCGSEL